MHHMCESGDTGDPAFFEVERLKVSLTRKLLGCLVGCAKYVNAWQVLSTYTIVLSVVSFALVLYLKLSGELVAFCMYDTWLYLVYYVVMSIFVAALIPMSDFEVVPPEHCFWRWARRMGAYALFLEVEGIGYLTVYYKKIQWEIEFDEEAQLLIFGMATVGFLRLMTTSVGYWFANNYLKRVAQRKKLSADYYGNTWTDMTDILVGQLAIMSLFYYHISFYNICFILSIVYLYVFFARI